MARHQPGADPYRTLGILPGADLAQIKAAHRQLAKRFHPDGSTGDETRFLAVQEAYQLLSDPVRRREWDRRHAPGPVRATSTPRTGTRTQRSRARRAPEAAPDGTPGASPAARRRGSPKAARPARPPGGRTTTWSAAHVPWWQDFRPRSAEASGTESSTKASDSKPGPGTPPKAPGPTPQAMDFDVFDRSSGAAWSSAARQHFRRGTSDLPSRGVWRYRGTQVVTGAEARKVAAEEDEKRRRRS